MRGHTGYYYPGTLKKMVTAALKIFNDVIVFKYDNKGDIVQEIKVPIIFGTQKSLHKARTNDEQKKYVPTFPRIEVRLNGLTFDESRLVSPNTTRFFNAKDINWEVKDEKDEMLLEINDAFSDFMPLPYNYNFTVHVFTESMDYLSQIIENIFPYFTLSNSTMRIREFNFLNIERDINIVIGSPELDLAGESLGPTDRRQANTNFSLKLEGWMYRRVEASKLVKNLKWSVNSMATNEELDSGGIDE